ncbi:MAG: hypothetical protein NZ604_06630 [Flavobacteriales bacterium]|nr:hypothetical protein [Flavobacteriales bacterium]
MAITTPKVTLAKAGIKIDKQITDFGTDFPLLSDLDVAHDTTTGEIFQKVNDVKIGLFTAVTSTGVFGISNGVGEYEHYDTLTLAMAAASPGDSIEQFANVTEAGDVQVQFKSVNFNGNGHTYTYTGSIPPFDDLNTAPAVNISDWSIIVTSGIGSNNFVMSSRGITRGSNFYIESTLNGGYECDSGGRVSGIQVKSFDDPISVAATSVSLNCYTECTGTATTSFYRNGGLSINCHAVSSTSTYVFTNFGTAINCSAKGSSGASQSFNNTGTAENCYSYGLYRAFTGNGTYNNCIGYAPSGNAVVYGAVNGGSFTAVSGIAGDLCDKIRGGVFITDSGGRTLDRCMDVRDATIINNWNNATGHGVSFDVNSTIVNCSIQVANASANCLFASSAKTVKYANNTFEGSTTAVHGNITQDSSNVTDAYGNTLI